MRLITLLFLSILYLFASPSILITQDKIKYENFSLGFLKDPQGSLNFQQVQKEEFKVLSSNFTLGYIKGEAAWFKIDITNKTDIENYILNIGEHFYEVAELYYKSADEQEFHRKNNSLFTPIEKRDIDSVKLSFPIILSSNETTTVYLRLKGKYAYFGNITLYPKNQHTFNSILSVSSLFLYVFGLLTIIVGFSLFLFIRLKEKIYGYYLGFSFFNLFYVINMSGLLGYVGLGEYLYKFYFSAPFMVAFLILFSLEFLEIKKKLPLIYRFLIFFPAILFTFGTISIFYYEPWNKIISNTLAICVIILIVISTKVYFMGNSRSKLYIIAIVLYFTSGLVFLFMLQGYVEYTFITRYILFFAIPIETIIFTLMLTDRYYDVKKQQIETEKELIEEKKNYHKNLEREVEVKTQDLVKLLNERGLLLKEVNHRVKNNFHMLMGMLWLDEQNNANHDHKKLINRIQSLSTVHETLYNSEDLGKINAKETLEKIIQNIKSAYQKRSFNIEYKIIDIDLGFEQAINLGVIVNELLTNSIVHNSKRESLNITLKILEDKDTLIFEYKDDGIGFEKESSKKGMGLKIINSFIEKLTHERYILETTNGMYLQLFLQKLHQTV
jgi:two-component sensor histidine kinase